ncbi:MAG: LysM domain-containing protein, partial [Halofilum sp. (in: g-proteobacteria)]
PPGREVVKPSAPVRYTVQRGDTLWDIAARFLRDPWVWPEVWQVNPQIENPHLIYPGDVITLTWAGDRPQLRVARPSAERDTRRLEPTIRREPLDSAIDSIPADAIRQFLNRPRVATAEEIEEAPYILGNYEGRLISASGNEVFAKGFPDGRADAAQYDVVRAGESLRDPETDEVLAYELIHAGKAHVRDAGPPARLQLAETRREILSGDRLMPPGRGLTQTRYIPRAPESGVDGQIIHMVDAISQVGTNQVVVVNLGEREDLEIGHVLAVEQSGGEVNDPHVDHGEDSRVQLPPQRVGMLMLFKVFDRVAYGLVLEAERPVRLYDDVVRP